MASDFVMLIGSTPKNEATKSTQKKTNTGLIVVGIGIGIAVTLFSLLALKQTQTTQQVIAQQTIAQTKPKKQKIVSEEPVPVWENVEEITYMEHDGPRTIIDKQTIKRYKRAL